MIRMLDHTADVGFEIEAEKLEGLFGEGRKALLTVMFEKPPERAERKERINLSAPELETLLVRWLNELVYLVQGLGEVPVSEDIEIQESRSSYLLDASVAVAPLELGGYGWQGEVKGTTFHGLNVENVNGNWHTRVILDV